MRSWHPHRAMRSLYQVHLHLLSTGWRRTNLHIRWSVHRPTQRHDRIGSECHGDSIGWRLWSEVRQHSSCSRKRMTQSTQVQTQLVCVALYVVPISAAHRRARRGL